MKLSRVGLEFRRDLNTPFHFRTWDTQWAKITRPVCGKVIYNYYNYRSLKAIVSVIMVNYEKYVGKCFHELYSILVYDCKSVIFAAPVLDQMDKT